MGDSNLKKAGIIFDNWKLPIFERHLKEAGFEMKVAGQFTEDSLAATVLVEASQQQRLAQVILAANTEAAASKGKR